MGWIFDLIRADNQKKKVGFGEESNDQGKCWEKYVRWARYGTIFVMKAGKTHATTSRQ